jgi:hypothetical protein
MPPAARRAFAGVAPPALFAAALLSLPMATAAPDESTDASDEASSIVVEGTATGKTQHDAPGVHCGLLGIGWSIGHPLDAWRLIAPVPEGTNTGACLMSDAVDVSSSPAAPGSSP